MNNNLIFYIAGILVGIVSTIILLKLIGWDKE